MAAGSAVQSGGITTRRQTTRRGYCGRGARHACKWICCGYGAHHRAGTQVSEIGHTVAQRGES